MSFKASSRDETNYIINWFSEICIWFIFFPSLFSYLCKHPQGLVSMVRSCLRRLRHIQHSNRTNISSNTRIERKYMQGMHRVQLMNLYIQWYCHTEWNHRVKCLAVFQFNKLRHFNCKMVHKHHYITNNSFMLLVYYVNEMNIDRNSRCRLSSIVNVVNL